MVILWDSLARLGAWPGDGPASLGLSPSEAATLQDNGLIRRDRGSTTVRRVARTLADSAIPAVVGDTLGPEPHAVRGQPDGDGGRRVGCLNGPGSRPLRSSPRPQGPGRAVVISSRVCSKAPANVSRKYATSGMFMAASAAAHCSLATTNSRLPAITSNEHFK